MNIKFQKLTKCKLTALNQIFEKSIIYKGDYIFNNEEVNR